MISSIVEAVLTYAQQKPDALCLADAQQTYTYKDAKNAILSMVCKLKEMFANEGDDLCVLVECTQNAAYCLSELAIQLSGGVFIPIDRKFSDERISEIAAETGAKLMISSRQRKLELPFLSNAFLEPGMPQPQVEYTLPRSEQRAELLYSTGTTGKSKGIDLTHANDVAVAQNIVDGVEMEENGVEIIPVAMSHSHGLRTFYANMLCGNAVVLANGVTFLKPFFTLMDRYGVTAMDLVPSAWRLLHSGAAERLHTYADKLRYVQLGSAPLTESDKSSLRQVLPNSRLYNFYGSTESGRTCTYNFAAHPDKEYCIGRAVCNARVLVVDDDHKELPESGRDKTGFLAFAGPMNMSGYWKNPELTQSVLQDGILYSKDVGFVDEDGWIFVLSRKDDVINYGGVKIAPEEIEAVAMRCAGVLDCGCVGKEDPLSGQAPWLYIQREEGTALEKGDVMAFLRGNLDNDKLPKQVVFVEKIPRTFNGKLLRRELKEL